MRKERNRSFQNKKNMIPNKLYFGNTDHKYKGYVNMMWVILDDFLTKRKFC